MTDTQAASEIKLPSDVDSVPDPQNTTWLAKVGFFLCALYSGWHLYVLNIAPLETWTFRIMHIAGALILGFVLSSALSVRTAQDSGPSSRLSVGLGTLSLIATTLALGSVLAAIWFFEPGQSAPRNGHWPSLAGRWRAEHCWPWEPAGCIPHAKTSSPSPILH